MTEKEVIAMSQRELVRVHVIQQVMEKKITQVEAGEKIGLSDRQVRRIVKRVKLEGAKGIAHRLRGRESPHKLKESIRKQVLKLYDEKYEGFGPTLATEKLYERDGIKISDETLRHWLLKEGKWQKRKSRKHRQWRVRRSCFGEMEQFDGSEHDWFEGRGPKCVLLGYIDDATNKRYSRFYEYEGLKPGMDSLGRYIKKNGIPLSLYLDRHAAYKSKGKPTIEDELNNRQAMSQFERAAKELGIRVIHAYSAQAKGRIERDFKTYQDRLVKEMRLEGIKSIEEANKFLPGFLAKHNKRFKFEAASPGDLHRPIPEGLKLSSILCIKKERVLRNDFTVSYENKLYQVLDRLSGRKIVIIESLTGKISLIYKGRELNYKEIVIRPKKEEQKEIRIPCSKYRPPMNHPLKRQMFMERITKEANSLHVFGTARKESQLELVKH
ncbi:MAG: ISNCY family transposase [Candidatus Firestonebacteria bacterium]